MEKENKKPKEEAPESNKTPEAPETPVPGAIEAHPTAYTYVVEVSGEKIGTDDPVMAVVLSKLEQNSQGIKEILDIAKKAQGKK